MEKCETRNVHLAAMHIFRTLECQSWEVVKWQMQASVFSIDMLVLIFNNFMAIISTHL